MNNNIQCSIESSTTKIELNSAVDGVFLVPELEGLVGLPEIRTTSGVNAGYDGGWTSAQHYDARLISIRGVIASPDISKVEDKRRAIASLLGQGRKEQLTLRFTTEAGNAYAISVRTISCEMALQRMLTTQEFLIQLRADDPLIYDDGTTGGIAAILQPQRALGGFEIDFELPLAIGGGAEDTVVDNGNETVYPVIKMYGALHSPTVVNRTTNQQMQILADLQYSIDWHTYRSATGDYILVNDGLNGAPMTLSQFFGNAEQTTYSGKNLLNDTTAQRAIPSSGNFNVTIPMTIGAGTYSFGAFADGVFCPESNYYVFQFRNGSTPIVQSSVPPTPMTLTAEEASQVDNMFLYFNANFTGRYGGKHLTAMVCSGSTLGDYEPYTGSTSSQITPSPNPSYPQLISTVTGAQNIKVIRKNLWGGFSHSFNYNSGGIVGYTNNADGTISIPASTTTATSYSCDRSKAQQEGFYIKLQAGTYSVSGGTGAIGLQCIDISTGTNLGASFTITEPTDVVIRVRISSGETISATTIMPMVEQSATPTSYEPYQSQSYEVNLGKNLCSGMELGWLYGTDGSERANTSSVQTIRSGFIRVQPNTTYILSSPDYTGTWFWYEYKTDKSYNLTTNKGNATGIFTTEPNTYWVRFRTNTPYVDLTARFQLELGSTATTYAPYFTPIELAKIGTYQDRIYKSEGKWYIEKQVGKVIFDGSTTLTQLQASTNTTRVVANVGSEYGAPLSTVQLPLCDYFTGNSSVWSTDIQGTYIQSRYAVLRANNATVGATLDSFKTWLASHPTTVYYALATPITTEITDEALLYQLNFLASLYEGVNNISLVGTGAQGEMVIRYATDYTVNQDIITIDSQARTITLNGQDIYHLKTSESEFLVLAPGENKLYLTSEVSDDSGYAEVKFKQGYLSI